MNIAINTLGRAGNLRTLDHFSPAAASLSVTLFVERAEAAAYAAAHPGLRIVEVPDGCRLQRSRNAVLDHFASSREVIILDDDITGFRRRLPGEVTKTERCSAAEAISDVLGALNLGHALASISFSASNWKHPEPWEYNTRVCGVAGLRLDLLRAHDIRYDEEVVEMGDYDLAAQVLHAGLTTARSYRFLFETFSLGENAGGCQTYRTPETALASSRRLLAKWGPDVVRLVEKHGRTEVQFRWKKLAR